MKRILFVINSMEIGGTRRSLLNLLDVISRRSDVECSLLVFSPYGEYINEIPENVYICRTNRDLIAMFSSSSALLKRKQYLTWFRKFLLSVKKKLFGEKKVMQTIYQKHIRKNDLSYDMIVGFQEGGCNDYTALTGAGKKIFWIHNNYENLTELAHGYPESYEAADSINFVAVASMESFAKAMPAFADKMRVIKNVLPQELIRKQAEVPCANIFNKDCIHLVSVGRIADQKGFDRLTEAAKRLKSDGLDFEWIILGEGKDKEKLVDFTKENGLSEYVRFIGAKPNPYPYINQSDLYVLTSRYESQPMVLMEALTIGVPVLSTSFDSVNEIVQNRDFALTVENSTEGIYKGLSELIQNPSKIGDMKKNTAKFDYDNEKIIRQILSL